MKRAPLLITSLLLLWWLAASSAWAEQPVQDKVRIGVLAKRGEALARTMWQPTAQYLTEQIPGHKFEIVPLTFDEIPPVVRNGLIDFLIVNSAIYVDLSVRYNIRRILTMKNKVSNNQAISKFGTVVFTLTENSTISHWQDLRGKRLGAVHQTSLGGWILGQYAIESGGGDVDGLASLTFSGTHDHVIQDVLSGRVDVGVVRTDTLERMAAEDKLDLTRIRVINPLRPKGFPLRVSTLLVPEWPISKLDHVSESFADQVALALLKIKQNDPAAVDARITGWTIPQNYQTVHDILKVLDLPPYDLKAEIRLWSVVERYWYWILAILIILVVQTLLIANVVRLNRRLRQNQAVLVENEERFRSLFQQAAVGFAFTGPTGVIVQVNQRLGEISGYSEVELRQTNITDLLHAETLSSATTQFEAMRRGEINQFMLQTAIKVHQNGKAWVQLTLSAVRDERQAIKYLVAVFDDIGELKSLEHKLKREQWQKSLILDIAGDGILGLDKEGRHTFANPAAAKLLGYDVAELIGKESHSLWHHTRPDGTAFPASECPITAVLEAGIVHRGSDELFWRKDGSSFTTEYVSTPMFEEGQVVGAVVVFREHLSRPVRRPFSLDN